MENPNFLKQKYDLHNTPEVATAPGPTADGMLPTSLFFGSAHLPVR